MYKLQWIAMGYDGCGLGWGGANLRCSSLIRVPSLVYFLFSIVAIFLGLNIGIGSSYG